MASVNEEIAEFVKEYINKYPVINCFETPNLHILNDELQKRGMRICFMAEYFLPDINALKAIDCGCEIRTLEPESLRNCILPSGAMHYVKSGNTWMFWRLLLMRMAGLQALQAAPLTAKPCGRSALMFFRSTGGKGLPVH